MDRVDLVPANRIVPAINVAKALFEENPEEVRFVQVDTRDMETVRFFVHKTIGGSFVAEFPNNDMIPLISSSDQLFSRC